MLALTLHTGELEIGGVKIPCAVLEDGTRVITQRGMFVALGMTKNPTKGQSTSIDNRPGFLSANNLTPFISEDLIRSWTPVPFRLSKGSGGYKGNIAFGYQAKFFRWFVTSSTTRTSLERLPRVRHTSLKPPKSSIEAFLSSGSLHSSTKPPGTKMSAIVRHCKKYFDNTSAVPYTTGPLRSR